MRCHLNDENNVNYNIYFILISRILKEKIGKNGILVKFQLILTIEATYKIYFRETLFNHVFKICEKHNNMTIFTFLVCN